MNYSTPLAANNADPPADRVPDPPHLQRTPTVLTMRPAPGPTALGLTPRRFLAEAGFAAEDASGIEAVQSAVLDLAAEVAAIKRDLAAARTWGGRRR